MVLLYYAFILELRQGNFCVINIFWFRNSITGFPLSLRDFGGFEGGRGGIYDLILHLSSNINLEYPRPYPVTVPGMLGQFMSVMYLR